MKSQFISFFLLLLIAGSTSAQSNVLKSNFSAWMTKDKITRSHITPFIKVGTNEIKTKVVNNWTNRIIGDINLPEDERTTWCFVNPYNKDSTLQPS